MSHLKRLLRSLVIPCLACLALANTGCATTIAERYTHLERRAICVDIPGIEPDWTEAIFNGKHPISNLHPDVVDRVAPAVRTVFVRDPEADPKNVRYLPEPFNQLECPPVFAMLPSRDEGTLPLPEAAVDLLVHEQRPERMPLVVAQKLATCPSPKVDEVPPIGFSLRFNVYLNENGQPVSALMRDSTLGDRNTEGCFVDVLRTTSWSLPGMTEPATNAPEVAAVSIGSKLFLADGPMQAPNWSDILQGGPKTPTVEPPPVKPFRFPFLGVFSLLTPAVIGGTVFIGVSLAPRDLAPPWISELNPITKRPYISANEYEAIKKLTVEQIRDAQIKATQPQAPPAPVPEPQQPPPPPPPADPPPPPRREKPDKCPKIKEEIDYLIKTERPKTKSGYPQGYKGLAQRWREYAANEGKWGPKADGSPGTNAENHLKEYKKERARLVEKLDDWATNECTKKGHSLPDNAGEYAAQEPQLGPGKPLGPSPMPSYTGIAKPTATAPQVKKP